MAPRANRLLALLGLAAVARCAGEADLAGAGEDLEDGRARMLSLMDPFSSVVANPSCQQLEDYLFGRGCGLRSCAAPSRRLDEDDVRRLDEDNVRRLAEATTATATDTSTTTTTISTTTETITTTTTSTTTASSTTTTSTSTLSSTTTTTSTVIGAAVGCCSEESTPVIIAGPLEPSGCYEEVDYAQLSSTQSGECPVTPSPRTFRQKCCICGITERFVDANPEEGKIEGYVQFGEARMSAEPDAEQHMDGYAVYLVNRHGVKLERASYVKTRSQPAYDSQMCCMMDYYWAWVNTTLPAEGAPFHFLVLPAVEYSEQGWASSYAMDLWLGRTTASILDLTASAPVQGQMQLTVANAGAFVSDANASSAVKRALAAMVKVAPEMITISLAEVSRRLAEEEDSEPRSLADTSVVQVFFSVVIPADLTWLETEDAIDAISADGAQSAINRHLGDAGLAAYAVTVASSPARLTSTTTTTHTTTVTNTTIAGVRASEAAPGAAKPWLGPLLSLGVALGLPVRAPR